MVPTFGYAAISREMRCTYAANMSLSGPMARLRPGLDVSSDLHPHQLSPYPLRPPHPRIPTHPAMPPLAAPRRTPHAMRHKEPA